MRWPAPMAASSKCGETTTMRANTSGSTSPQVGSAKVSLMPGSYGEVVGMACDVVPEGGHESADDHGARDAREAPGDDGELQRRQRGHGARLEVAETRTAL